MLEKIVDTNEPGEVRLHPPQPNNLPGAMSQESVSESEMHPHLVWRLGPPSNTKGKSQHRC